MPRLYSVVFDNVSVSAAQDFFELTPADDKPIRIVGIQIGQTGNSDTGDAQEEMLAIKFSRGFTASGSGGTSVTPSAADPGDSAAGFTAESNNTTVANTGTETILAVDTFNVRAGYNQWYPPYIDIKASQANTTLICRLIRASADAITISGTVWVQEL